MTGERGPQRLAAFIRTPFQRFVFVLDIHVTASPSGNRIIVRKARAKHKRRILPGCMTVVADGGRRAFTRPGSSPLDGKRGRGGSRCLHRPKAAAKGRPVGNGVVCAAYRRLQPARVCHRLQAWQPVEIVSRQSPRSRFRFRRCVAGWLVAIGSGAVAGIAFAFRRCGRRQRFVTFASDCQACSHLWKPRDDGRCDSDRRQRLVANALSPTCCRQHLVPEGHSTIAQRFIAGSRGPPHRRVL